jgi:DNA invertase Pin-like site-specific DNA recombinase
MAHKMLRLDALIRVSSDAGRGEYLRSPEQQLAMCEQAASAIGGKIINRDTPAAINVSGGTMDRADIRSIRERLRDGLTDGVVVAYTDRLSRAPIEEPMLIFREITTAGGHFVIAEMGMDIRPDDPHGETMLVHSLQQARVQYLQIKKRWADSRGNAIKAGKAMGVPPFGYRFTDPTPRPHSRGVVDSRLVPDGQRAPIARELFERKVAGGTWLELARWLDQVAPKSDGRLWARSSVESIIRSRAYLGEVRHGENVHADAHEPLVSASLWRRAQPKPGRRTPRGPYLLAGLVRCAGCGKRMQGSSAKQWTNPRYICQTRGCPARYTAITTPRLDAEVVGQLFARLETSQAVAVDDDEFAHLEKEIERLTGEVERLAMVTPSHPKAVAAHQAALGTAESALADAEDHLARLLDLQAQSGRDVREIRADFWNRPLDEQREILRPGIDAVLVRRASRGGSASPISERVLVLFHGEGPPSLQNGRGPIQGWTWSDDPSSLRLAA